MDETPEDMTSNSGWRDDWGSTDVKNHSIVTVPVAEPPGFDLPRRHWVTLNRFKTGQGACAANLVKWGQATDPACNCGAIKTMEHIINDCPLTRFAGGLPALHIADDNARAWLCTACIR